MCGFWRGSPARASGGFGGKACRGHHKRSRSVTWFRRMNCTAQSAGRTILPSWDGNECSLLAIPIATYWDLQFRTPSHSMRFRKEETQWQKQRRSLQTLAHGLDIQNRVSKRLESCAGCKRGMLVRSLAPILASIKLWSPSPDVFRTAEQV